MRTLGVSSVNPRSRIYSCFRPDRYWIPVIAIAVIGFLFRIYRLDDVSPWYDDYVDGFAFLKAPDLGTYFSLVRFLCADHPPIFFLTLYSWAKLVGVSLYSARLLGVLFGVASLPIIYLCGKTCFGRTAGLIAMLCMAMSPLHVWLSQEVRPTPMAHFFAAVSLYTFLRMIRGGGSRWWIANVVSNLLFSWTIVMGLLMAFTQLIYLVATGPRRKLSRIIAWGGSQFVFLLPMALWLFANSPYTVSAEEDYYDFSVQTVLVDLLADDAISINQAWMFTPGTHPYVTQTPYQRNALTEGYGLFNLGLLLFFVAALTTCCAYGLRALWRAATKQGGVEQWHDAGVVFFLLLLTFVPLLTLLCLSFYFRPVLMPRYTAFSPYALYVMAGALVGFIPTRTLKGVALAVLVTLYGYQLTIMLPTQTRTDWLGAALAIEKQAMKGDLTLVRGRFMDTENFNLAARDTIKPVLTAYTMQALYEKVERYLTPEQDGVPRRVWAVINEQFDYPKLPVDRLEQALISRGFACSRTNFPGMGGVALLLITRSACPVPPGPPVDLSLEYDYKKLLGELAITPAGAQQEAETIARLKRVVETNWPLGPTTFAQFSVALCDEGCTDLAIAAARKAIRFRPEASYGYFALAVALGEAGRLTDMQAAIDKMLALDTIALFKLYIPLFDSMYMHPDIARMREGIARLDEMRAFVPQAFRARAGFPVEAALLKYCS